MAETQIINKTTKEQGKVAATCLHCHKDFLVNQCYLKRGGGKYCSPECNKAAKAKPIRQCKQCGNDFIAKNADSILCSKKCVGKSQRKSIEKHCLQCQKAFLVIPALIETKYYCSRLCYAIAKQNRIQRECKRCGAEFETHPSRVKQGGGIYCSDDCFRNQPVEERFWSKVKIGQPDECWPWQGTIVSGGYGQFTGENSQPTMAHRYAFESKYGSLGELKGLHKCDNPPCCNPDHIFAGTSLENTRDMISKGRDRFIGRPKKEKESSSQDESIATCTLHN